MGVCSTEGPALWAKALCGGILRRHVFEEPSVTSGNARSNITIV